MRLRHCDRCGFSPAARIARAPPGPRRSGASEQESANEAERTALCSEQIRATTERLVVQHRRERLGVVTTSVGVATLPHSSRDAGELLRRVDTALYKAKQQGRNRLVFDDAGEVQPKPA